MQTSTKVTLGLVALLAIQATQLVMNVSSAKRPLIVVYEASAPQAVDADYYSDVAPTYSYSYYDPYDPEKFDVEKYGPRLFKAPNPIIPASILRDEIIPKPPRPIPQAAINFFKNMDVASERSRKGGEPAPTPDFLWKYLEDHPTPEVEKVK